MNVSLTSELEAFVNQKVESGMYQTASEVVREGLRLLRERDQDVNELRRQIALGVEQVRQKRVKPFNEETVSRIKSRGRGQQSQRGRQPS